MTEIVVLLHDIRSSFNVGSILRTSDGMGIGKVIFSGYTPYPTMEDDTRLPHERKRITAQIGKTALGAEKNVKNEVSLDARATIAELKANGYKILALEQHEESMKLQNYEKISDANKVALLLGEEVHGISDELLELMDGVLEIPMLGGKESFNVSVAFAMAAWEMRRGELRKPS